MPALTSVVIRWLHVVAAALVLGGAGLAWWTVRSATRTDDPGHTAAALSLSRAYEWAFWAAVGVLVATGVGNLGVLAPTIPEPGTDWGTTLSLKLVAVFTLLVGSVVRTVLAAGSLSEYTVRLASGQPRIDPRRLAALRSAYAITTIWLLALVGLAEVLAHG
jgi:uncharacterized membrane protein